MRAYARLLGAALGALLLAASLQHAASQPLSQPQGFIRVSGGQFVDDQCQEFLFHGWNGWLLLKNAMDSPASVTEKFQQAQAAGLNVMRFFIADDEAGPTFLRGPTDIDEAAGRGLDFIVSEASKYGIRLTVVLLNLWKAPNGVPSFEKWCGTAGKSTRPRPDIDPRGPVLSPDQRLQTPYDWLMSPTCRQQVKGYFAAVVNRVNTINGRVYRDDPTILSWNLLNEPRCMYCGPEAVDSWYGEMAQYMKSIDPNHMVSTGAEGFFAEGDPMDGYNPGRDPSMWGPRSGQDFRANNGHPAIDFATMHMWADNWSKASEGLSWAERWIDSHAQVAGELGKPLVLEEFGKEAADGQITAVRDPWFGMVFDKVDESVASGGPLRAALFWQWDGPWGEDGARGEGSNLVRVSDSTFQQYIVPFAKSLEEQSGQVVPGCIPR